MGEENGNPLQCSCLENPIDRGAWQATVCGVARIRHNLATKLLLLKFTLEKEMATHSSILAWRIPWTEEPGGLQSMGSQRVGHYWVTHIHTNCFGDKCLATYVLRASALIILKEGMFLPLEKSISVGNEGFLDNDINIGLLQFHLTIWKEYFNISSCLIILLVSRRFQMTFRKILWNIPWCKLMQSAMSNWTQHAPICLLLIYHTDLQQEAEA